MVMVRVMGLVVGILLVGALMPGCGAAHKILQVRKHDPAALGGATRFYVAEPKWDFDQKLESAEAWTRHVFLWNQAFVERLQSKSSRVTIVADGRAPKDGIAVTVSIVSLTKNPSLYMGHDHLHVRLIFQDVVRNLTVLDTDIDVDSSGAGPLGYTFGGRIKSAVLNLAASLAGIINRGQLR